MSEPVSSGRLCRLESRSQRHDEVRAEMLSQLEDLRQRVGAIEGEKRDLERRLETSEARCRSLDQEREDMKRRLSDLQRQMDPLHAEKGGHHDAMHKLSALEERLVSLESCVKDEVHSVFMRMKSLLKKMEVDAVPSPSPFDAPSRCPPFQASSVTIKHRRRSTPDTSSDSSLESPTTSSCKSFFDQSTSASCKTLFSPFQASQGQSTSQGHKPLFTSTPYRKKFFCSDLSLISENSRASLKNRQQQSLADGGGGGSGMGGGAAAAATAAAAAAASRRSRLAMESSEFVRGGTRPPVPPLPPRPLRSPAAAAAAMLLDPRPSPVNLGVADLFFDPADKFIETALEEDSIINKVANTFSLLFQSGLEDHMEDTQLWSSIQWAVTKGLHQSLHRCLESVPQNDHRGPQWDLFDTETILDLLKDK